MPTRRFTTPEPYVPRSVSFLELLEHDGWRVTLYGIAYGRDRPDP